MAKKNQTNTESVNAVDNNIMKQFRDLKEKHKGAILLFRCGDFYEAYNEDAEAVSKILDIALTKSDGNFAATAGFPYHALDRYLPVLIRKGKRVAIVEPLANPADKPATDKKVTIRKKIPQLRFEEYERVKNGKTKVLARIVGFAPDSPYYVNTPPHSSKSELTDKDGNKCYALIFGQLYVDVAKTLCDALNSGEEAAINDAIAALDGALTARREERIAAREKYAANKQYSAEEVANIIKQFSSDGTLPDGIAALLKAA